MPNGVKNWLLLSLAAEVERANDQNQTVEDIAEHHSKHEWEGNDGEETGVNLFVVGSSVGGDQFLERESEFVLFQEGRLLQQFYFLLPYLGSLEVAIFAQVVQGVFELFFVFRGTPEQSVHDALSLQEHVQRLVYLNLLFDEQFVNGYYWGISTVVVMVDRSQKILDLTPGCEYELLGFILQLIDLSHPGRDVQSINFKTGRVETLANALDLFLEVTTDFEDDHVNLLLFEIWCEGGLVLRLNLEGEEWDVCVAPGRSEEQSLESELLTRVYDTAQVAEKASSGGQQGFLQRSVVIFWVASLLRHQFLGVFENVNLAEQCLVVVHHLVHLLHLVGQEIIVLEDILLEVQV